MDIHVTTTSILNFLSTKNLFLNRNWWTLWATYLSSRKTYRHVFLTGRSTITV